MTRTEVAFAIISGLAINEVGEWCPWLARGLVRWAARVRYRGRPERAAQRAEELGALIDARPGKLFKLITATGFAGAALPVAALQLLRRRGRAAHKPQVGDVYVVSSERLKEFEVAGVPAHVADTRWSSLFPRGRDVYYEGDDPAGFANLIEADFGFNPARDPNWGMQIEGNGFSFTSYGFHCPPENLDSICGNDRFPLGS